MVTAQVLPDEAQREMKSKLEQFASVDESENLMKYLYEERFDDGAVEVRFFAMGPDEAETGPTESIYFEVTIEEDADWYENVSAYGRANLRNGGPLYEALADELEELVKDATGARAVDFVARKGSGTFTEQVEV